nr:unnamed protein product [Digitaria exilis]
MHTPWAQRRRVGKEAGGKRLRVWEPEAELVHDFRLMNDGYASQQIKTESASIFVKDAPTRSRALSPPAPRSLSSCAWYSSSRRAAAAHSAAPTDFTGSLLGLCCPLARAPPPAQPHKLTMPRRRRRRRSYLRATQRPAAARARRASLVVIYAAPPSLGLDLGCDKPFWPSPLPSTPAPPVALADIAVQTVTHPPRAMLGAQGRAGPDGRCNCTAGHIDALSYTETW